MLPPGRQFAAPYRALVNSGFYGDLFCSPIFFAAPWPIFAAPIIFLSVAKSDGFMYLYNFCPWAVAKAGVAKSGGSKCRPPRVPPPTSGVSGPVVTPLFRPMLQAKWQGCFDTCARAEEVQNKSW